MQEEAKRLAKEGETGRADIDKGVVKTRVEKLYQAENATDDLLKQAKEANESAHFAIINGTRTLNIAKENLKLLEV